LPATQCSLILVLLDDVGVEYLDYHGLGAQYAKGLSFSNLPWHYFTTPRLTSLAHRGVFFQSFFSTALCSTTRVRIHTGKRLDEIGVGANVRAPNSKTSPTTWPTTGFALNPDFLFLAEHLRAQDPGIETAHFGKWHMCDPWSTIGSGLAAHVPNVNLQDPAKFGFQTSTWGPVPYGGRYSWWRIADGNPTYVDGEADSIFDETTHAASVMSNAARAWISERTGPFFCSVSLEFTHMPLDIPPVSLLSAATRSDLRRLGLPPGHRLVGDIYAETPRIDPNFWPAFYANAEAMDTVIGRIEGSIPEDHKASTYIVVLSDNGGTSAVTPVGFPPQGKDSLTRGGTNVTCVVYGPGVVHPGRAIRQICDIGDVYATVAELMGHPTGDGVSLAPAIADAVPRNDITALKPYSVEQSFFPIGETDPAHFVNRHRSIVDGSFRYIDDAGPEKFFDLRIDPLEAKNIIAAELDSDQQYALNHLKAILAEVLPTA
jgi:arylsulfatase A-like enzyme